MQSYEIILPALMTTDKVSLHRIEIALAKDTSWAASFDVDADVCVGTVGEKGSVEELKAGVPELKVGERRSAKSEDVCVCGVRPVLPPIDPKDSVVGVISKSKRDPESCG